MVEPQAKPYFRLFVAIVLPEDVKEPIRQAQGKLRAELPEAPIRWTTSAQFHLTLRFLGNVLSEQVPALAGSLAAACRQSPQLRLRAAGIGFFPTSRSPRVVWVGVSDVANRLEGLHAAVQGATAAFTSEEPETRAYAGHITLGRIQRIGHSEAEALAAAAQDLSGAGFGEWTASDVHLIRSELSPKGARYTTLQAFPLQSG